MYRISNKKIIGASLKTVYPVQNVESSTNAFKLTFKQNNQIKQYPAISHGCKNLNREIQRKEKKI